MVLSASVCVLSIKLTLRNIFKKFDLFLINSISITIGFAFIISILSYINEELSTDTQHLNYNSIYRLDDLEYSSSPGLFKNLIDSRFQNHIPVARLCLGHSSPVIKYKNEAIRLNNLAFADKEIFDIFSFDLIKGDKSSIFNDQFSIVLTESFAKKLFGNIEPVGEIIKINNNYDFVVTGIIEDMPDNSSFNFSALANLECVKKMWNGFDLENDYSSWEFLTYLKIADNEKIDFYQKEVNNAINDFLDSKEEEHVDFKLYPLKKIYFNTQLKFDFSRHQDKSKLLILFISVLLIFLIVIFNYRNYVSTQINSNLKNISIIEIFTSNRFFVYSIYLFQSVIFLIFAIIFSVPFIKYLKSFFFDGFSVIETDFLIYFLTILLIFLFINILTIHIVSRERLSYRFKKILNNSKYKRLNIPLIFQLVVTITMITSAMFIKLQTNFLAEKDLGFAPENTISINMNSNIYSHYNAFMDDLEKIPGLEKISTVQSLPGESMMIINEELEGNSQHFYVNKANENYIDLFEIEIKEGRFFDKNLKNEKENCVINEAAAKQINFNLSEDIKIRDCNVIGIMKNFHFRSLHHEIEPLVIFYKEINPKILIKFNNISSGTIQDVESVWERYNPNMPFEYESIENVINHQYRSEKRLDKIITAFGLFVLIFSVLGLINLLNNIISARKKEFVIKRILGLQSQQLFYQFSIEYIKYVTISFVISSFITYFLMDSWLREFTYKIDLSISIFIISFIISILSVLLACIYAFLKFDKKKAFSNLLNINN
ncbi:MAG: FtsX-like permease family protein [Bacteroidales bacterium]|nr:FtsX-like permease family protein [Bacteroidales bacterium]